MLQIFWQLRHHLIITNKCVTNFNYNQLLIRMSGRVCSLTSFLPINMFPTNITWSTADLFLCCIISWTRFLLMTKSCLTLIFYLQAVANIVSLPTAVHFCLVCTLLCYMASSVTSITMFLFVIFWGSEQSGRLVSPIGKYNIEKQGIGCNKCVETCVIR